MDFKKEAKNKLEREAKAGKFDRYAAVMKPACKAALLDFIEQNEEFAQAIAQGGSFEDCMKAVAKNCGSYLSDIEAYQRAVAFYFKGAEIKFKMEIQLEPQNESKPEKEGLMLDLSAWL